MVGTIITFKDPGGAVLNKRFLWSEDLTLKLRQHGWLEGAKIELRHAPMMALQLLSDSNTVKHRIESISKKKIDKVDFVIFVLQEVPYVH